MVCRRTANQKQEKEQKGDRESDRKKNIELFIVIQEAEFEYFCYRKIFALHLPLLMVGKNQLILQIMPKK